MLPRLLAAVVLALLALPAAASGAPRVQHIKYRFGPLAIHPGQNTISFDGDKVPRPKRAGWIVGFRPNLEYTNGKIPGVDVLHLHHAVWLINGQPDVRGRRGEDERQAAAAVRLAPPPRGPLGAQPHGPQPAAEPRPRLPHLHDRLHPGLVAARQADAAGRDALGRRRGRQRLSRLRRAPGDRPQRALHVPERRSERLRRRVRAQPAAHPARRRAGADRRTPASRRAVHRPDAHAGGQDRQPVPLARALLGARRRGLVGRGDDRDALELARQGQARRRPQRVGDLRLPARVVVRVDGDHARGLRARRARRRRPVLGQDRAARPADPRAPAREQQPRRRGAAGSPTRGRRPTGPRRPPRS